MKRALLWSVVAVSLVAVGIASNSYRSNALLAKTGVTRLSGPADRPDAANFESGSSPAEEDQMLAAADEVEKPAPSAGNKTAGDKSKPQKIESAVFAGGCFWCTEAAFEQIKGVIDVESGYTGGTKDTAEYHRVSMGDTGHAESIRVHYDPAKISYERLLDVFFDAHDPTQLNRQGNDVGSQYRSVIFFANEAQEKVARAKIKKLSATKFRSRPIVTAVEPLSEFYPAETYHQNYVLIHPNEPYIRYHAIPLKNRVKHLHPDLIKKKSDQ